MNKIVITDKADDLLELFVNNPSHKEQFSKSRFHQGKGIMPESVREKKTVILNNINPTSVKESEIVKTGIQSLVSKFDYLSLNKNESFHRFVRENFANSFSTKNSKLSNYSLKRVTSNPQIFHESILPWVEEKYIRLEKRAKDLSFINNRNLRDYDKMANQRKKISDAIKKQIVLQQEERQYLPQLYFEGKRSEQKQHTKAVMAIGEGETRYEQKMTKRFEDSVKLLHHYLKKWSKMKDMNKNKRITEIEQKIKV